MKKLFLSVLALLAFAASGTAQTLPSYVPANGLVGWWPFNGNANDESGNNNNGTVNGATLTTDRFGNAGKAYGFDGQPLTSIRVSLTNSIQGSRTFNFWTKFTWPPTNDYNHILTFSSGNWVQIFGPYYAINNTLGKLSIYNTLNSTTLFNDNKWHNVAVTVNLNTNQASIFIDGNLNSTGDITNPSLFGIDNSFGIGNVLNPPGNAGSTFTGSLDDIAIYNRALTQQEITSLYQGANTTASCPTFPASLTQGLVGYWPFCGNALDESGNNNHGTVNGATLTTDRFGNAGSAYNFNGINNYIMANHNDNLNVLPITISAWFSYSNPVGRQQWLVSKYPCESSNGYSLHMNEGRPSAFYFSGNGTAGYLSLDANSGNFNPLGDGNWHQYSIVLDLNKYVQYVDGDTIGTGLFMGSQGSPTTTIENLFFGKYPGQCSQGQSPSYYFFEGNLDDIAIWNRALTPQEIKQVYNQGICQTSITVTDTLLIHTGITSYNPVAYGNTLKVWPNPTNTAITLDAGNLSSMQGWKYKVANTLGQTVVNETAINQQQTNISLSTWGGNGIYYLHLINPQGHAIEIKKIVLAP